MIEKGIRLLLEGQTLSKGAESGKSFHVSDRALSTDMKGCQCCRACVTSFDAIALTRLHSSQVTLGTGETLIV